MAVTNLVMAPVVQEIIFQHQGAKIWGGSTRIEVEKAQGLTMITRDMALTVPPRFRHLEDADIWGSTDSVETNILKELWV